MNRILLLALSVLIITSCTTAKKKAELANPKPDWIGNRSFDPYSYTGIGIAKKWGTPANYQSDARDKALADMAAQINSQVSTTSVLYQVENRQGISEILASNIKSSSKEFLEGYELVDEWQDETSYYVCYKLSRVKFAELKEKRRQTAMTLAHTKYLSAVLQQNANQSAGAILLYTQVLEALKNYFGEANLDTIDGAEVDLATNSLKAIKQLINDLQVTPITKEVISPVGQIIDEEKLGFTTTNKSNVSQPNIPVSFTFTGGYLRKDNALSDAEGVARTAIHQNGSTIANYQLCAKIDVVNLTRQLTRELLIRKLIEGTAGNSACITITTK